MFLSKILNSDSASLSWGGGGEEGEFRIRVGVCLQRVLIKPVLYLKMMDLKNDALFKTQNPKKWHHVEGTSKTKNSMNGLALFSLCNNGSLPNIQFFYHLFLFSWHSQSAILADTI